MASQNCSDTYQLIRGPKGDVGVLGEQGAQPLPERGVDGLPGAPGRSKIDIATESKDTPYRFIEGVKYSSNLERVSFGAAAERIITSFIYNQDRANRDVMELVNVLISPIDSTATDYTGSGRRIYIDVFTKLNSSNEAILGSQLFTPTTHSDLFDDNDTEAPSVFPIFMDRNLPKEGNNIVYVRAKIIDTRGVDLHVYAIEVY